MRVPRHRPSAHPMVVLAVLLAALTVPARRADAQNPETSELTRPILQDISSPTALVVVIGVPDAELALQLAAGGKYLVHGLCRNDEQVTTARNAIAERGLVGVVSVDRVSAEELPYSSYLVNMVVVPQVDVLQEIGVPAQEILRVLAPGGVAWLGPAREDAESAAGMLASLKSSVGAGNYDVRDLGGQWIRLVKPRPDSMDTWTHKRRDASSNPVSQDALAGVPSGVRWVAGPNWPTGYRKSAVPAVVASQRQLVYVFQDEVEGPRGSPVREDSLIARDAYNGLQLWRRKTESAELVCDQQRVYTIVDRQLTALDSSSGEVVRSYPHPVNPGKFVLVGGQLVVAGGAGLSCLDADTGATRWNYDATPRNFVAGGGHVYLHADDSRRGGDSRLVRVDLATGKELWSRSTRDWEAGQVELILLHQGVLVFAGPRGNHAVAADGGKHLWHYAYPKIGHGGSYEKVLAMKDLVWIHTADTAGSGQYAWEGLEPRTGHVAQRIVQPKEFNLKHRCSYDVATERYFMCGSMDFADSLTGEYRHFDAARNSCAAAGVLPANGLLYSFPHACGCYPMLRGFLGLASEPAAAELNGRPAGAAPAPAARLITGPAYEQPVSPEGSVPGDWPTYRRDPARSGSTPDAGPTGLAQLWQAQLVDAGPDNFETQWDQSDGDRLTSPVVAHGILYVAATDAHCLFALDARTGRPLWRFVAGGRIDCPPSIDRDLCLFGARDGWVYCLDARQGTLRWRLRAAPEERRIVAYGQLESVWPVYGGVLAFEGLAYFVCGRHTGADGGLLVEAVEPRTGRALWTATPGGHEGVPDVLTASDGIVRMASWEADAKTGRRQEDAADGLRGGRLGLLNDAWYERPIAMRKNLQQWSVAGRPAGQTLSFNEVATSGYVAYTLLNGGTGALSGQATLFAGPRGELSGWKVHMPTTARLTGMVLAGDRLYAAGNLSDSLNDTPSSGVRVYSLADGALLETFPLEESFVHDCLAVAGGRVYLTTRTGKVFCLGGE